MSSILKVDTIQDQDGNNIINENANVITIGASGDTITIPSGASMSGFSSTGIDDNATSTAITIDSSQNVGISTASPNTKLTVTKSDGGALANTNPSIVALAETLSDGVGSSIGFGYDSWQFSSIIGFSDGGGTFGGGLKFKTALNNSAWRERLRIDSEGDISFYEDTGTTPKFFWDASAESLGIGTSSPSTPLHISTSDENVATFASTDTAARIVITDGTDTGYVNVSNTAGTGIISIGQFQGLNGNNLNVDDSGNVGIGTTSPSQPLDVLGSAQISYSGANTYLYFQSTSNFIGRKTDGNLNIGVAGSQNIVSSIGGTERMRIDSSGNVGINTTNPSTKLHVKDSDIRNEGTGIYYNLSGGFVITTGTPTVDIDISSIATISTRDQSKTYEMSVTEANGTGSNLSRLFYVRFREGTGYDITSAIYSLGSVTGAVTFSRPSSGTWRISGTAALTVGAVRFRRLS
jgi:hypothetical protein